MGKFNLPTSPKVIRNIINSSGFTLIELIIVTAIISILAVSALAILDPLAQFKKASDARIKSDLSQIQRGLEAYNQDKGRYPPICGNNTYKILSGATCINWGSSWQPYMNVLPSDPIAGHTYIYNVSSDGQTYYLYANLNRGRADPQVCNNGNACNSLPAGINCGGAGVVCNFVVTSANALNP